MAYSIISSRFPELITERIFDHIKEGPSRDVIELRFNLRDILAYEIQIIKGKWDGFVLKKNKRLPNMDTLYKTLRDDTGQKWRLGRNVKKFKTTYLSQNHYEKALEEYVNMIN
jgi:hypothetical protein